MRIVVIGGSGLVGSAVVARLRALGLDAVPASRSSGVDVVTGDGLAAALSGATVVVDVSDSPSFDGEAAQRFFTTSTRNQLAAGADAGVRHHVALSVVGVDRLPENGYFRAKLAQEELIAASPIPHSILRATPFYEFVLRIADDAADGDTVRLPPVRVQPVAAADVAAELGRIAVGPPLNNIVEIAGPHQFRLDELVWDDLTARDDPRTVVADPRAQHFGALLRDSSLVPDTGATLGATPFTDWLRRRTGAPWVTPVLRAVDTELEREITAELALGKSSRLDEAMQEPVTDWLFDPTEAQRYEVLLRNLLGAMHPRRTVRPDAAVQPGSGAGGGWDQPRSA